MYGSAWTGNKGAGALSISQSGSTGGSPPASGPGDNDTWIDSVEVSATDFSHNWGTLYGGLILNGCGSVMIRGSSFVNNSAQSDEVRSCKALGLLEDRDSQPVFM
jgi:hypothetical protein